MFKVITLALPLMATAACALDETVSGYADPDTVYHLVELDGAPAGNATITFPSDGTVRGRAPCNSYFGTQTEPYPWFNVDAVGATRMACPDLEAEGAFFKALTAMTLAEVTASVLILSNEDGRHMVFEAR